MQAQVIAIGDGQDLEQYGISKDFIPALQRALRDASPTDISGITRKVNEVVKEYAGGTGVVPVVLGGEQSSLRSVETTGEYTGREDEAATLEESDEDEEESESLTLGDFYDLGQVLFFAQNEAQKQGNDDLVEVIDTLNGKIRASLV